MRRPNAIDRKKFRGAGLAVILSTGLSLGAGAVPASAQSGVVMGTDETLLHLLDENGSIAVDFDVDDVFAPGQRVRIGRADTGGFDEVNIDLSIVHPHSTLSNFDPSFLFDASQAALHVGAGSSLNPGVDGDLHIENGMGSTVIHLDGGDGDINQDIDNTGTTTDFDGNGAVKAWAIINADGTVNRCWRCRTNSNNTQRLGNGIYEVDFSLGSINNRPVLATVACTHSNPALTQCNRFNATIDISPRINDASTFFVDIAHPNTGNPLNNSFTIVVF